MTELTHKVTGRKIRTDEASADFWKSAGYVEAPKKSAPAKKAPAKKSASSKSEK